MTKNLTIGCILDSSRRHSGLFRRAGLSSILAGVFVVSTAAAWEGSRNESASGMSGSTAQNAEPEFGPIPGEVLLALKKAPEDAALAALAEQTPEFRGWEFYSHKQLSPQELQQFNLTVHPLALRLKMWVDPAADVTAVAQRVAAMEGVVWAAPNGRTRITVKPDDPRYKTQQYGPQIIEAPKAWDITMAGGARVVLAVADTGLYFNHEEFQGERLWVNKKEIPDNGLDDDGNGLIDDVNGWDFYNHDNRPVDGNSHGSHVSGIAAANTHNGVGIAGMAGNVKIMPLQVFGDGGSGTFEAIEQAIYYAVDEGATLINYSGGGYVGTPGLAAAAQYAYDHNVPLVAAAGNANSDREFYPAAYPPAIAVAGTDSQDQRYGSSNFGPWIDVAAPGVDIISASNAFPADYRFKSGTSMASPHVAGLVALMKTVKPDLTSEEVLQLLAANAVDLGDPGFDVYFGHGRVNAAATLEDLPLFEVSCAMIRDFRAICNVHTLKVVLVLNDSSRDGATVFVTVDGDKEEFTGVRGHKAKWRLKPESGTRTVALSTPAGCVGELSVTCP